MERTATEIEVLFNLSHGKFAEDVIRQTGKDTNAVRTWIRNKLLGQVSPLIGFQRCRAAIETFNKALIAVYQPSRNEARCKLVSNVYLPILHEALSWLAPEYLREKVQLELITPLKEDFLSEGRINLDQAKECLTRLLGQHKQEELLELFRKNQASDRVKIAPPILAESLEKRVLDAMDELRSSILEELPQTEKIYRFIETILFERLRRARIYQIPGVFINPQPQGEVRNIRVTIFEPSPNDEQEIVYEIEIAEGEKGQELRQSVSWARSAAIKMLRKSIANVPNYVVRIEIEGKLEESFEGGSFGLAVALAIFAAATNQQVGIENVGDLAVTGAIKSRDGAIDVVAGIVEKAEAALQAGIPHLLLPKDNLAEITHITGIKPHPVSSLGNIVISDLLFDPWHGYLNALVASYRQIELPAENWKVLFDRDKKRLVAFRRFYADNATEAKGIVRQFAELRFNEPRNMPVPVLLDIANFHRDSRLLDVATATIQNLCKDANVSSPESSIIEQYFSGGRVVFVVIGLDDYGELPSSMVGGGIADMRLMYSQNKQIFVCRESTWNKYAKIVDSKQYNVIPLYEGRSTFLDKHIVEVKTAARSIILPCPGSDLTPQEFFQDYYIELKVQRLDRNGNRVGSPKSLSEIIAEGQDRHILLLADGGAGKTTLLLKLFFDCIKGKCKLSTPEAQRNDSWKQLIVPLFANVGKLNNADIYQLLPEPHSELEITKNILILLDGLNEITPKVRSQSRELSNCFHQFIRNLDDRNPNHWVVVSCRLQEDIRGGGSLIRQIEKDEGKEYFVRYELLDLPLEAAKNYLRRQTDDQLINILWERVEFLKNPMLLYLLSTLEPDRIGRMERDCEHSLNRTLIYQMAIDGWISKQFERGLLEIFKDIGFKRGPRELLRCLAKEMFDKVLTSISEEAAIEVFRRVRKKDPGWWPRHHASDRKYTSEKVLEELVAGGLLRFLG